jgi:hypothetical protein
VGEETPKFFGYSDSILFRSLRDTTGLEVSMSCMRLGECHSSQPLLDTHAPFPRPRMLAVKDELIVLSISNTGFWSDQYILEQSMLYAEILEELLNRFRTWFCCVDENMRLDCVLIINLDGVRRTGMRYV